MNGTAVNIQHALQQKYIGPYTPKDSGNWPAMTVVKDERGKKQISKLCVTSVTATFETPPQCTLVFL